MGFCGCSLAASTLTAVVLGLVESIYGISWNILVIVLTSPANQSTVYDESGLYYSNVSYTQLWDILREKIESQRDIDDLMFHIVIAALVLNAIWLITTLALAVGNAEKCSGMVKPWIIIALIITITDIAATVFFIFKAVKDDDINNIRTAFFTNLYVFYAFMYSRGGPILWIINVALCVYVAQRVKEIEVNKGKRNPFSPNFSPYSLNPPYDAFETGSSTRTAKDFRPNTPPPDYEGKKRLLMSELPASSRGSSRPLSQNSYLYDDRVELQHRASCAAETVLHHGYVNQGLVMDSEGWMGIPRPSLKPSHP